MRIVKLAVLYVSKNLTEEFSPKHVYSKVTPIVFNTTYFQESVVRIVALVSVSCSMAAQVWI